MSNKHFSSYQGTLCCTYLQCKLTLNFSYFFGSSSDICTEKKRSKMSGEDVFTALKELGFDKYEEELREFMKNYNADKEDTIA